MSGVRHDWLVGTHDAYGQDGCVGLFCGCRLDARDVAMIKALAAQEFNTVYFKDVFIICRSFRATRGDVLSGPWDALPGGRHNFFAGCRTNREVAR
ncbi:MAG: hypothetical protein FD177_2139 [Desulfovibrionaceae bacterium]|nr:MAG: hypothetical protein FD177_2139 [Desulfovibrionaceae bacterium]